MMKKYELNKCNDIISKIKGKTGSVVDVIKTNKTSYSLKIIVDLTEF